MDLEKVKNEDRGNKCKKVGWIEVWSKGRFFGWNKFW